MEEYQLKPAGPEDKQVEQAGDWLQPKVKSSHITRFRYDAAGRKLYVGFRTYRMKKNTEDLSAKPEKVESGDIVYSYADVPEAVFLEMQLAESAGKFLKAEVLPKYKAKAEFELVTLHSDKE